MIPDEAVEVVARALWMASPARLAHNTWEYLDEGGRMKASFRSYARKALEVAAPVMFKDRESLDRASREIADHIKRADQSARERHMIPGGAISLPVTTTRLISIERDGEVIFSLAPDGTIACDPENYELALREICQIFVKAAS